MSVINQMLEDLEARRAADKPALAARQLSYETGTPRRGPRRRLRLLVWAFAAVTAGTLLYAGGKAGHLQSLALLDAPVSQAVAGTRNELLEALQEHAREAATDRGGPRRSVDLHPPETLRETLAGAGENAGGGEATAAASLRRAETGPAVRARPPADSASVQADQQEVPRLRQRERKTIAPAKAPVTQIAAASPPAAQTGTRMKIVPRPPTAEARFAEHLADARRALARRDTVGARESVRQALRLAPDNAAAAELLVAVQLHGGDRDGAIATLRAALGRDPHNTAYAQTLARLLAARGETGPALEYLRAAHANGRGDGDYLALMAALERRSGDHQSAAAHYLEALALNRSVALWWLGLGMSLEQLQRPDEARAAFQEAQRIGGLAREVAAFVERRVAGLEASSER